MSPPRVKPVVIQLLERERTAERMFVAALSTPNATKQARGRAGPPKTSSRTSQHGTGNTCSGSTLSCTESHRPTLAIGTSSTPEDTLVQFDLPSAFRAHTRFNLACHYAGNGQESPALDALRAAVQLDPSLREQARQDPDLQPLRAHAAYQTLMAESARADV